METAGLAFLIGLAIGYVLGMIFLAMVVCGQVSDTDRERRQRQQDDEWGVW